MSQLDKRRIAIHEAGHAVAMHRLLENFDDCFEVVSILPGWKTKSLGYVSGVNSSLGESKKRWHLEVVIDLAGYAASIAAGLGHDDAILGCDSDFERANKIIRAYEADFEKLMDEALDLMALDINRRAVAVLADELLEYKMLLEWEPGMIIDYADGDITYEELKNERERMNSEQCRRQFMALNYL